MKDDQAQALRALREQVKLVEKYLDKCQLYGPADHLRGAVERCVVLADALSTAPPAPTPPAEHRETVAYLLNGLAAGTHVVVSNEFVEWLRARVQPPTPPAMICPKCNGADICRDELGAWGCLDCGWASYEKPALPEPPADAPPAPEPQCPRCGSDEFEELSVAVNDSTATRTQRRRCDRCETDYDVPLTNLFEKSPASEPDATTMLDRMVYPLRTKG